MTQALALLANHNPRALVTQGVTLLPGDQLFHSYASSLNFQDVGAGRNDRVGRGCRYQKMVLKGSEVVRCHYLMVCNGHILRPIFFSQHIASPQKDSRRCGFGRHRARQATLVLLVLRKMRRKNSQSRGLGEASPSSGP